MSKKLRVKGSKQSKALGVESPFVRGDEITYINKIKSKSLTTFNVKTS